MPDLVPFTDNFRDLSNTEGYQFEFHCERCGNGHRSAFQRDNVELSRKVLRGIGSFFGGTAQNFSNSVDQWRWDRGTNSAAKDKALAAAVEEVRDQFRQCRGCGDWMCAEMCWNADVGQCLTCSPSVAEELSRAQASAQKDQMWEKARDVDWTKDLDLGTRTKVQCPSCGAKVDGGKFCSSCGGQLALKVTCGGCGSTENRPGSVFCAECGNKL